MYTITTSENVKADFFILRKGENAGKPVKKETPNSFKVVVNQEVLNPEYFFYVVKNAFNTGQFKRELIGGAIKFLTIKGAKAGIKNSTM